MSFLKSIAIIWWSLLTMAVGSPQVHDLSAAAQWTVSSANHTVRDIPAKFPSQVHLDLLNAGQIDNPFYGDNMWTTRWICWTNWTYTGKLKSLDADAHSSYLVFNGLDTFVDISLCGEHVGSTDNMFRQYVFDVSDTVTKYCKGKQEPLLELEFASAPEMAYKAAGQPLKPGEQPDYPQNKQFIRKEQNDFSWDWVEAFMPAGPWQSGYFVQSTSASDLYETNTFVDVYKQGQVPNLPPDQSKPWVINASIDVVGSIDKHSKLTIEIDGLLRETDMNNILIDGGTRITGSIVLDRKNPQLWWPVEFGSPRQYDVKLHIKQGSDTLLTSERKIGFRTIVLNEEPVSSEDVSKGVAPGNYWHFEINGHPFYSKGSNLVPPEVFWPNLTVAKIEDLFDSVIASNQNMLRVWSSGAYLPDFVYDVADRKGILLWSEFEFSDAQYPVDNAEFMDSVRAEAEYQIRRVNYHPSLALWAGGNELEAIAAFFNDTAPFQILCVNMLTEIIWDNLRSISYIPSSTTNGYLELNPDSSPHWVNRYNNITEGHIYGDKELYDYDPGHAFNYGVYPEGRFVNEFGYESMPSIHTWRQVLDESQMSMESTVVLLHTRHYSPSTDHTNLSMPLQGINEMISAVEMYFPTPHHDEKAANFSNWCLATQLFQAEMYRSQIAYYRRGSGFKERNLGSLYWQLEDIWQGPTWAGIEYDGRWKVLNYGARDIYNHVIIAAYGGNSSIGSDSDVDIYVTSDLWKEEKGTATYTWYDWSGKRIGSSHSQQFTVGELNTTKVFSIPLNDFPKDKKNAVLLMEVRTEGHHTHRNWFHPVTLRDAKLKDPKLKIRSIGKDRFEITSESVSPWTWIDLPDNIHGYFDDNGFMLLPGEKKTVKFTSSPSFENWHGWQKEIELMSVWGLNH